MGPVGKGPALGPLPCSVTCWEQPGLDAVGTEGRQQGVWQLRPPARPPEGHASGTRGDSQSVPLISHTGQSRTHCFCPQGHRRHRGHGGQGGVGLGSSSAGLRRLDACPRVHSCPRPTWGGLLGRHGGCSQDGTGAAARSTGATAAASCRAPDAGAFCFLFPKEGHGSPGGPSEPLSTALATSHWGQERNVWRMWTEEGAASGQEARAPDSSDRVRALDGSSDPTRRRGPA